MSNPTQQNHIQEPQHHDISADLDDRKALMNADCALIDSPDPQRSQAGRNHLQQAFGFSSLSRLAYRPQPAPSQYPIFAELYSGLPMDVEDLSFYYLMTDAQVVMDEAHCTFLMNRWRKLHETHILTIIDTAASLERSAQSLTVRNWANSVEVLVRRLNKSKKSLWLPDASVDFRFQVNNYCTLVFAQRLTFYNARLHGKSMKELYADLKQLNIDMNVPLEYGLVFGANFYIDMHRVETLIIEEMRQIQADWDSPELFSDNVQLEWVEAPIPVENVSTTIGNPEDIDCPICRYQITPPGIRTLTCHHAFCKECLESWIHACEKASHTCPYCRTELFPNPAYRLKPPSEDQRELAELRTWLHRITKAKISVLWFEHELELQRIFELDMKKIEAATELDNFLFSLMKIDPEMLQT